MVPQTLLHTYQLTTKAVRVAAGAISAFTTQNISAPAAKSLHWLEAGPGDVSVNGKVTAAATASEKSTGPLTWKAVDMVAKVAGNFTALAPLPEAGATCGDKPTLDLRLPAVVVAI